MAGGIALIARNIRSGTRCDEDSKVKNVEYYCALGYSRRISGTCNSTIFDTVEHMIMALCMWDRLAAEIAVPAQLAEVQEPGAERTKASILRSLLPPEFPPMRLLCCRPFLFQQSMSCPSFPR